MGLLELIIVILVIIWALGFFGGIVNVGGLIHLLLVVAVIILIIRLIKKV